MISKEDWRLRGQEDYLYGKELIRKKFISTIPDKIPDGVDLRYYNDHEHCDFCWHKFMENCEGINDCSTEGYVTVDGRVWICDQCYDDFKDMFKWTIKR